ncbi:type II toxin-antitoxin system CcdA family antitoxin [Azoarcus sp. DD4]|uniref:type II toxin-antitoxin system CcdA family antitoxin n=1 Tax=Azoarcus sp. DD4 TaxID=2027405 RepID=UPI00197A9C1C|nr:type II toxin-antitoxin system CcdA family antitoxin [Azoarcus sp. DD4]
MTTTNNHATVTKKAANVSRAETLLTEAEELRISISQAADAGLAKAMAEKRAALLLQGVRKSSSAGARMWGTMACRWRSTRASDVSNTVYRNAEGVGCLVDLQADVSRHFATTVVVAAWISCFRGSEKPAPVRR